MNTSRKNLKKQATKDNFILIKEMSFKEYLKAERNARCRVFHRKFREEFKYLKRDMYFEKVIRGGFPF